MLGLNRVIELRYAWYHGGQDAPQTVEKSTSLGYLIFSIMSPSMVIVPKVKTV